MEKQAPANNTLIRNIPNDLGENLRVNFSRYTESYATRPLKISILKQNIQIMATELRITPEMLSEKLPKKRSIKSVKKEFIKSLGLKLNEKDKNEMYIWFNEIRKYQNDCFIEDLEELHYRLMAQCGEKEILGLGKKINTGEMSRINIG